MRLLSIVAAFSAAIAALPAMARPVSYPGGWTVMQMNDGVSSSLHVHYSPTATYSVGYKGEYFQKDRWQFQGVQLNNLLHRWNNQDSQANLYVKSAVGIAYSNTNRVGSDTKGAAFTGIAADWEDRRFFVSYENRGIYAGDIDKEFSEKARLGIAPYVGDYGDLHSWFMLQVDHAPSAKEVFTVTPLVRLFKGPTLAEAGISNKGKILVNFVQRF